MLNFYDSFSLTDKIFFFSAISGSALFIIMSLLQLIGADGTDGCDIDAGIDNIDGIDADGASVHGSFQLLTIQGLTAFFMLGGLAGLFFSRTLEVGKLSSVFAAFVAGVIALYCNALLIRTLSNLQSSGTLKLTNTIGQEAEVYLTVKQETGGQVQLEIQGRLQIFDAITEDNQSIPTGTRVKVHEVINNKTLLVSKLTKSNS